MKIDVTRGELVLIIQGLKKEYAASEIGLVIVKDVDEPPIFIPSLIQRVQDELSQDDTPDDSTRQSVSHWGLHEV